MTIGVSIKIDVTKIDKNRLFEGKKGKYLDATVFINPDEADQHGNHGMVTQDVSKEERDNGVKGNILGNVKVFWQGDGKSVSNSQTGNTQEQTPQQSQGGGFDNFDDDIPF